MISFVNRRFPVSFPLKFGEGSPFFFFLGGNPPCVSQPVAQFAFSPLSSRPAGLIDFLSFFPCIRGPGFSFRITGTFWGGPGPKPIARFFVFPKKKKIGTLSPFGWLMNFATGWFISGFPSLHQQSSFCDLPLFFSGTIFFLPSSLYRLSIFSFFLCSASFCPIRRAFFPRSLTFSGFVPPVWSPQRRSFLFSRTE